MVNQNNKENDTYLGHFIDEQIGVDSSSREDIKSIQNYLKLLPRQSKTIYGNKIASKEFKINQEVTAEDLGLDNFRKPSNDKIIVKIIIISVDDDEGIVYVKIVATINEYSNHKEMKIDGFVRKKQEYQERLRKLLFGIFNTATNKNNILPQQLIAEIDNEDDVTAAQLGIYKFLFDDDIIITHQISNYDNNKGEVEINVILSIVNSKVKQSKKIKILGYKNQLTYDKENIELFKQLFLERLTTNKSHVLPNSIVNSNNIYEDLGIKSVGNNHDIIITYVIKTTNNNQGFLNALVIFQKNQVIDQKEITITGYKTTVQYEKEIMNKIKNIIMNSGNPITTTKKDTLPSSIGKVGDKVFETEIGIVEFAKRFEQMNASVWFIIIKFNDFEGKMSVTVNAKTSSKTYSSEITIFGFKKLKTQYEEDVEMVASRIKNQQITSKSTILPSKIQGEINATNLGIDEVMDKIATIISYELVANGADDEAGTLQVKVIIKKPLSEAKANFGDVSLSQKYHLSEEIIVTEKVITIKNFKTRYMQHRDDVQTVIASLSSLQLQSDKKQLPSKIVKTNLSWNSLKIQEPEINLLDSKMVLEMQGIDDDNGTINIAVTISKGETSMQKIIIISNYKTSQEVFDELLNKTSEIPQNIPSNLANKLPSEV